MNAVLWITGASGFTGRHLVRHMLAQADRPQLIGLDVAAEGPPGLDSCHAVDITRSDEIAALARAQPPRWVIHLAGAMPPADEGLMWQVNVGGAMSLLDGLAAAGCRGVRVVGIGSAAEYVPRPGEALTEESPCGSFTPYGRTKWAQTLLTLTLSRTLDIEAMIARTFNLIGPGLPTRLAPGALAAQFRRTPDGGEVLVGNTRSARDFIDIRDAVSAYWEVALRGAPGEVYNICTGVPHTIEQLLQVFLEVSGRNIRTRVDPARLKEADASVVYGSAAKLMRATGWQPRISLRGSVSDMLGDRMSEEPGREAFR